MVWTLTGYLLYRVVRFRCPAPLHLVTDERHRTCSFLHEISRIAKADYTPTQGTQPRPRLSRSLRLG